MQTDQHRRMPSCQQSSISQTKLLGLETRLLNDAVQQTKMNKWTYRWWCWIEYDNGGWWNETEGMSEEEWKIQLLCSALMLLRKNILGDYILPLDTLINIHWFLLLKSAKAAKRFYWPCGSAVTIPLLPISIDISSIFSKYRDIDPYRYLQSVMPNRARSHNGC